MAAEGKGDVARQVQHTAMLIDGIGWSMPTISSQGTGAGLVGTLTRAQHSGGVQL